METWWSRKTKECRDKYGISFRTIRRFGLKTALEVYDRDERKCTQCGSEEYLTIHHIDRNGRNKENEGLSQNNDINNLVILCRKCHGSIHGRHSRGIKRGGKHLCTEM